MSSQSPFPSNSLKRAAPPVLCTLSRETLATRTKEELIDLVLTLHSTKRDAPSVSLDILNWETRSDEKRRRADGASVGCELLQLVHEGSLFRTIADCAPVMIWISGLDKKCIYFNQPWLKFTGRQIEDEMGDGWANLVHADDFNRCLSIYTAHFDRQKPFTMTYRLRRHDGEDRWLLDNGVPYFSSLTGRFEGFVGSCIDITDHVKLEQELKEACSAKSDFLALMSHEIRTPLATVIGMAELMVDVPLVPEIREYVGSILKSARHLLLLINDLLDIAKLDRSSIATTTPASIPLVETDFYICKEIMETCEMLRPQAQAKQLRLTADNSDIPEQFAYVRSDPLRLRQVLVNIIGNAIKFTDLGSIIVRARYDNANRQFEIIVADTGAGVPASYRSRLFTPFTQAERPDAREKGGTGLGLYLSSLVVRSLGGSLSYAENTPTGSTFTITLPLKIVSPSQARLVNLLYGSASPSSNSSCGHLTTDGSTLSPQRNEAPILVCDDNETNRKILTTILHRLGYRYETASNGEEAVQKANTSPYQLIFMDAQMPRKDGFAATREIRSSNLSPNTDVPIIALTALALAGDRERCIDAGMSDYISKPFSRLQIKTAIDTWKGRVHEPPRDQV